MDNYIYNGKFQGNVLIVGKTFCRKIQLVQKLAANNVFGNLKQVKWFSYIKLI